MTTSLTPPAPRHLLGWLVAGLAVHSLLPWALARAARLAGRRDFADCHESSARSEGAHATALR